jgi:hypothetical protein
VIVPATINRSANLGNSSLSVEQVLGSFNFMLYGDGDEEAAYFKASLSLTKFAMLHHANYRHAPVKYSDPITVAVYEKRQQASYRMWVHSYDSVTQFLNIIHSCVPWDQPSCDITGCNAKPMFDAMRCEKHME